MSEDPKKTVMSEDPIQTTSEEQDPERGCGTKANDACYAEGGGFSAQGTLRPWTWLLGDGLVDNIYLKVPPRQIVVINPVATITLRSLIGSAWPFEIPEKQQALFNRLSEATKNVGVADHVGTKYYSPFSFATECIDLGPSRRISKDMAKELAEVVWKHGPIPMLFTHSRMPVFRHEENRARAFSLVKECYENDDEENWDQFDYLEPTWLHKNWGMYGENWAGHQHRTLPILTTLSIMDRAWKKVSDSESWNRFKMFFTNKDYVQFIEQPFGMSWLCKVSYTLDENGQADPEMVDVPGLNIIDLKAVEEGKNEQVESAPLGAD
jgi:hypothetical protein